MQVIVDFEVLLAVAIGVALGDGVGVGVVVGVGVGVGVGVAEDSPKISKAPTASIDLLNGTLLSQTVPVHLTPTQLAVNMSEYLPNSLSIGRFAAYFSICI